MIAVFGGSFNPVTLAHKQIVDRVLELDEVKEVIIVPVSDRYEKDSLTTDFKHRIAMLKLVMDEHVIISDYEALQDYQPKSLETLIHFSKEYDDDLALIIGSDNLEQFSTWYRPAELISKFWLIVINRQSDLEGVISGDELLSEFRERIIIIDDLDLKVSSSQAKKEMSPEYLDERVLDYIDRYGLYRSE